MSAWLTDADLKTAVAARMHTTSGTLATDAPQYDTIIEQANDDAYQMIVATLLNRGYTTAQINGWDRRVNFNRAIGICYALRAAALTQQWDSTNVEKFCTAEADLEDVPIVVDGEVIDPDASGAGVSYGDFDDSRDVFTADMQL